MIDINKLTEDDIGRNVTYHREFCRRETGRREFRFSSCGEPIMIPNTRLDELAAMEQAATAGPWEDKQMSCQTERHTYRCEVIAASKGPSNRMADLLVPEDARFIAASRNEFAAMIEQCKEANRDRQDALRYRWLRLNGLQHINFKYLTPDTCDVGLDHAIDAALKGPTE